MKRSTSIPSRAQSRPVTPLTSRQAIDPLLGPPPRKRAVRKGPHILSAVRFLDGVLLRMQAHPCKERDLLRRREVSLG
ncbi:MAG: hypothetical protein MUE94_01410 [Verrucomicrobia bacterium]|jgi:hypothetical protein|nr:hypothetical protein [Verrucomicrobiota bacterium]